MTFQLKSTSDQKPGPIEDWRIAGGAQVQRNPADEAEMPDHHKIPSHAHQHVEELVDREGDQVAADVHADDQQQGLEQPLICLLGAWGVEWIRNWINPNGTGNLHFCGSRAKSANSRERTQR